MATTTLFSPDIIRDCFPGETQSANQTPPLLCGQGYHKYPENHWGWSFPGQPLVFLANTRVDGMLPKTAAPRIGVGYLY